MTPIHSYNYTGNEGTLGPNTGNSHGPPPSRSIVECPRSSPPRKYQWISENIQAAIQPNDIERKRASFSGSAINLLRILTENLQKRKRLPKDHT